MSKAKKKKVAEKNVVRDRNFFLQVLILLGKFFWFVIRIPYFLVKYIVLFLKFLFNKTKSLPTVDDVTYVKGNLNSKSVEVPFDVLDSIRGSFDEFVNYLKNNDSFIAITIGARGAGKTASSLAFLEKLRGSKKHYFAMGFSRDALPDWIFLVDDVSRIKNDSLVVVDEGGILFSSRSSMSDANKFLSELLMVARHKNISIIFISQNSSNLEINTLRQADVLILKKHSLLQKNFERKIIAKLYEEYESYFDKHKQFKGTTLVFSDQFVGFLNIGLPSYWSNKTSKSFEKVKSHSKDANNLEK